MGGCCVWLGADFSSPFQLKAGFSSIFSSVLTVGQPRKTVARNWPGHRAVAGSVCQHCDEGY